MDSVSEGSPSAARSALTTVQDPGGNPKRQGLIHWWLARIGRRSKTADHAPTANGGRSSDAGAENPFHSSNPPVEDVAVPKAEIVAVPIEIKLAELVEIFKASGRTRLPVYRGSLDSPCGFIHLKDLALQQGFNGSRDDFELQESMLRNLLYVPGAMRVATLLEQMRSKRIHMALIIDEYGGTDGLVTIEDLVEVIFGDIADEHDDHATILLQEAADGSYLCHAHLPLEDLGAKLGNSLALIDGIDDEVDSLGGLVFVLAGRVPVTGEVIRCDAAGLEFEIVSAEPQRVRQVRVRQNTGCKR